jgi:hypothetical protein
MGDVGSEAFPEILFALLFGSSEPTVFGRHCYSSRMEELYPYIRHLLLSRDRVSLEMGERLPNRHFDGPAVFLHLS